MANIVIKHCPVCSNTAARAEEAASALKADFDLPARVEKGKEGEFTVIVDDVPVIQRGGDELPTVDEVTAAVRNAVPVGA